MNRRLILLLSGVALAACSEPGTNEGDSATQAETAQALPGDPLCKLPAATNTALPAGVRRFTGLASTRTGTALAAGDLDDDGRLELVIGSPSLATSTTLKGYVHVVPLASPLDISRYSTRYEGEAVGNRLGAAVAVGDFVTGTRHDLLMGAPSYTASLGIAYPVDGSTLGGGDKPLGTLSPRLRGATAAEQAGTALAVGDISGDGVDDVIVGAPFYDTSTTYTDTGAVYAYTGPVTPSSNGQLSSAPVRVLGGLTQTNYQAGSAVAVVDVNGDGIKDLVVGAPRYDAGALVDAGAVFVFFGPVTGLQNFAAANLVLTGAVAGELTGSALASAGDLDGDGLEDLLIGAPASGTAAGKAYVVYGGSVTSSPFSLAAQPRFSGVAQDLAGTALLGPGDINGDGFKDVLIGAPGFTANTGAVFVAYGAATRFTGNVLLSTLPRYIGVASSETGRALVALGDVDGDGSADFVVGSPGLSNAGAATLVLGYGPRTWYVDNDSDGYGTSVGSSRQCGEPAAGSKRALVDGDCDDTLANVYPGADEVCEATAAEEIDNNCDGLKGDDPGANPVNVKTWVPDGDGDLHVYFSAAQQSCVPPATSGWIDFNTIAGLECDPPPGNPDPNFTTDNDPSIHQFAPEVCDGKDNNCDGTVDEDQTLWPPWYPDGDGDGYGRDASPVNACVAPPQHVGNKADCDDTSSSTHPGATEVCDNRDNDCDGSVDEGVLTTFYRDADGDGHGVPTQTVQACSLPSGYAAVSDDCNDTPGNGALMYPGRPEVCDGLDNNCNFDTDEGVKSSFYLDTDGDGFGNPYVFVMACSAAGYVTNNQDCDDSRAGTHPGATEVCDGRDNNCSGTVDEGVQGEWYPDADGDGVGTSNATFRVLACSAPSGYVASHADCHDGNAAVKPGAPEICDRLDNDCDSLVDEGLATTSWYVDADGDGHGQSNGTPVVACASSGPGYVSNHADCNDANASISPSQVEVCEASGAQVDNNCDGNTEGAVDGTTWYRDVDGDGYGATTLSVKRCVRPAGYVAVDGDCNDAAAQVNPGMSEVCEAGAYSDQVDNDCDGDSNDVDPDLPQNEGGAPLWYGDADKDGHAGTGFQLRWCTNPTNLVDPTTGNVLVQGHYLATPPDDCDDTRSGVYKREIWYEDRDGDGCGNPAAGRESCGSPAGCGFPFVLNSKDTSDSNPADCRP
ncbi:FG-GAP-like repeat-containing protein [Myxococcus stipitatus]|uniref:MopE-related protein n=1 Tax=Myxococcus stipitatus TaxID=83455 RepID=UPI001F2586A5|nr:MopE-related protein [Myxococcus stipitatus]MCE9666357.1 FG-GAP-like repeat-containing protein [Myxococcus stipitatus]